MAKKLNIAELDDDARFEVQLSAPVQVGRTWARPGLRIEMKGKIVKEHAENVADVRALAD